MGIDIYASWRGQTQAEADEQLTGFSVVAGNIGYLREAYHGGPYVTKYLLAEVFAAPDGEAAIPAATLRERLPAAVLMHLYRENKLYGNGQDPSHLELDKFSDLGATLKNLLTQNVGNVSHTDFVEALLPESIETAKQLIVLGMLPDTARALVDFVALCERKERQTGQPCTITASY